MEIASDKCHSGQDKKTPQTKTECCKKSKTKDTVEKPENEYAASDQVHV